MDSTDEKLMTARQKLKVRKPSVAPRFQSLSPVAALRLLSRHADNSYTELRQMIESIDHLHGEKGS